MVVHHVFAVCQTLSVWTGWPLLSCAWSQTVVAVALIRANAASSSGFVGLLGPMASWSYLAATHHLA